VSAFIRPSRPGDEPQLRAIWKTVFGDGDAYIGGWFGRMYAPGDALVCEADGRLVSSAYVAELGGLSAPGAACVPVCVVYALGTLPEYRGRGAGADVTRAALERCLARGAGVICPAEPSLFGYYAARCGYRDYFGVSEFSAVVPSGAPEGRSARVSAGGYAALRERLLAGRAHIAFFERALAYQEFLCGKRGGLFRLELAGAECAAAVELSEDGTAALVKELLAPDALLRPAACLAARAAGASRAEVRTPVRPGVPSRPFAMLAGPAPEADGAWFGFAFD